MQLLCALWIRSQRLHHHHLVCLSVSSSYFSLLVCLLDVHLHVCMNAWCLPVFCLCTWLFSCPSVYISTSFSLPVCTSPYVCTYAVCMSVSLPLFVSVQCIFISFAAQWRLIPRVVRRFGGSSESLLASFEDRFQDLFVNALHTSEISPN